MGAAFYSILIGIVFLWISAGRFNLPLKTYMWNMGYSVCIGIALFANGWIFYKVRHRYINWFSKPLKSIVVVLLTHLLYSTFAIFIVNGLWFFIINKITLQEFLSFGRGIIIGEYIVVAIVTTIFYAKGFFIEWKHKAIEGEKLKNEALQLQYQILQNQVNPHFLFNTLNVLGALIDVDQEKAKAFTRELSLFYRDLLNYKDQEVVELSDELHFVERYLKLQKIRFGENVNLENFIPENIKGMVIPMSIKMLIENHFKQHEVSSEHPLNIILGSRDGGYVFVENNMQPKKVLEASNHIGLDNLKERYRFLTGKEVEVLNHGTYFRVTLPLLTIKR